jgi:GAF domain-containing protein
VIFLDYYEAEIKIKEIISRDKESTLSRVVDFLHDNFDNYSWVGIYIVKGNDLFLWPWKGPHATEHTKIPIGKGICGSAAATGKTEIIDDVSSDSRYLSCFISTRSEIVVPIKKDDKIIAEIDIDSDKKNAFTKEDKDFLEKIADMLSKHIKQ